MSKEIAIDLGTANSLVYVQGKGIVIREPSVVAIEKNTGRVLAVGDEAKKMIGRTPGNIVAVKPLKDGFIADFDVCSSMLKYFFGKALNATGLFSKPKVIICVPAGTTSVEERAVRQAAMQAGAKEVHIMEEPMAAAIGAGAASGRAYRQYDCRYRRRYYRCGSDFFRRDCNQSVHSHWRR